MHRVCLQLGQVALEALACKWTPTFDYYLSSRIESHRRRAEKTTSDDLSVQSSTGAKIQLLVRHVSLHSLLISKTNDKASLIWLLDDDLRAAWKSPDVPRLYGLRTTLRYWSISWLVRHNKGVFWVSTPALSKRYPGARVVPPRWFGPLPKPSPVECMRWGYHGTLVHVRERQWIVSLVERVQRQVPDAVFEIFGGASLRKALAHIPRVEVLPPLGWGDYLRHARSHPLAVGVAPLLPGSFNSARSHTKAFDILRTGAVGIFSAREPYLSNLHASGALFATDEQVEWAEHVVRLLQSGQERAQRFSQHLNWLEGQCAAPTELEQLVSDAFPAAR